MTEGRVQTGLDPADESWQHGDVAVYSYPPYPNEEPVRVVVAFCGGDRTWRNAVFGGAIGFDHIRNKGGLTLLIRDGLVIAPASTSVSGEPS